MSRVNYPMILKWRISNHYIGKNSSYDSVDEKYYENIQLMKNPSDIQIDWLHIVRAS